MSAACAWELFHSQDLSFPSFFFVNSDPSKAFNLHLISRNKKLTFGTVTLNTMTASKQTSQLVFCKLNFQGLLLILGLNVWLLRYLSSFSGHACILKLYLNNVAVKYKLAKGNCCSVVRLNFVNTSVCLSSELSCLLCDAAVETLMVCLIFTSAPPTVSPFSLLCGHRLSPPVRGRDLLIDRGCMFYVSALCSQLAALRNMSVSVNLFFLSCYVIFWGLLACRFQNIFSKIFSVLSSLAYVMMVTTVSGEWEQHGNLIDHGHN